ncbi:testisin-like isoform X4 [Neofelis nebulosa]|uniref:testisin-like isoform X4 n=1 Tax=Neofelis nebulosa TaxID=61452 RepID=UPI00272D3234|nr:testisin-like isoform X4 [Neofelis nebulosa]
MGARVRALLLAQLLVRAGLRGQGELRRGLRAAPGVVGDGRGACRPRGAHLAARHPPAGPPRRSGSGPAVSRHTDPFEWSVQFGELSASPSIWNLEAYHNRYQVEEIILNPMYLGASSSDIALLKLSSSVTYNKYIHPVCVAASSSEFQNQTDCWVMGWGHIGEDQVLPAPYLLQEVQVGIIDTTMCNYLYTQPLVRYDIWGDTVCAGDSQGGKDSCFGDSGGPLACEKRGVWIQVGIVSWGSGCGSPNRPGVYTNISRHFNWIRMLVARGSTHRPEPSRLLLPLAVLWAGLPQPA